MMNEILDLYLGDAARTALLLSLKVASVAVLASLPFAVLTAWLLARRHFPGKVLIDGLVHLPLILPPVVMGYLLLLTFGSQGPMGAFLERVIGLRFIFSWTGAVLATAIMTFPLQVRSIRLAFEAIDPGLIEAAATLGASPLDRFFSILLPLALPGLIAGAIIAFAAALGEFGAIITFVSNIPGETRTLPLAIYTAIQLPGGDALAMRLAGLSIVLALAGLFFSELAARKLRDLRAA